MEEINWTLSINRKQDYDKIKLLEERGKLLRMTTICGRPVCWEYELNGAYNKKTGNPVHIMAWIGTGK